MVLDFIDMQGLTGFSNFMVNGINQNPNNVQIPNYSGVNIQIFNPMANADGSLVIPSTNVENFGNCCATNPLNSYPPGYYIQNYAQQPKTSPENKTKQITELSENYVKTLEAYLNSDDKELRTMAAKEVIERMKEDKSRKNNEVLIALNNKMLKDPSQPIRFMAMGAIEAHYISGNQETVDTLNKLQNKRKSQNPMTSEDAINASSALVQLTKTMKEIKE